MKLRYFLFLMLLAPLSLSAQRFQWVDETEAEEFLKGVLWEFGLSTKDIRIKSSKEVTSAAADMKNGQRYIYYNPDWILSIGSTYGGSEFWLKMGIITHEIGHHMKGHTLRDGVTNPRLELEADWWAGFAMRQLEATEAQALMAAEKTAPPFSTPTHPARRLRKEAFRKGYLKEPYSPPVTLGGQVYATKDFNGLTWMTENLNYEVDGSWCYNDDPRNCNKYGRLYTWEAAMETCWDLGLGWRLPSGEEWKALAKLFGGYYEQHENPRRRIHPSLPSFIIEMVDDPKKAYKALLKGGSSGFDALLGSFYIEDFKEKLPYSYRHFREESAVHRDARGFYWSHRPVPVISISSDLGLGFDYEFDRVIENIVGPSLFGRSGESMALSCRCVYEGESAND